MRRRSGAAPAREADRQYRDAQLQSAHWLTKSLEQRARTILNVAAEIVRRQDGFLVEGVAGLRPLNLRAVADAIGVHEFDSFARHLEQVHPDAARPVRDEVLLHHLDRVGARRRRCAFGRVGAPRIKQMIDAEDPNEVLSDDVIVARLKAADIVVARRTVAKYRDNLRIPSSVDRRRLKMAAHARRRAAPMIF